MKAHEGTTNKSCRQIQDINVWLQCFATYITVMASKFPKYTPQLLACMVIILKASQEHEGTAWAAYDVTYRQQAASTGHRGWSEGNTLLYVICFTAKGKRSARCKVCLSAGHHTADCPARGEKEPSLAERIKLVESVLIGPAKSPRYPSSSTEICNKFNMKRCSYRWCKYHHVCSTCKGNQPALDCPMVGQHGGQYTRGPGPCITVLLRTQRDPIESQYKLGEELTSDRHRYA